MTIEEVFANDEIQFIILRPGFGSSDGISILKKFRTKPEDLDGYTFKGMFNNKTDMVEFIKDTNNV